MFALAKELLGGSTGHPHCAGAIRLRCFWIINSLFCFVLFCFVLFCFVLFCFVFVLFLFLRADSKYV
jgi:hypothetical protein